MILIDISLALICMQILFIIISTFMRRFNNYLLFNDNISTIILKEVKEKYGSVYFRWYLMVE